MAVALSDESISELIARSANGDSAALRTLYEHTAPQLFAVLLRILQRKDLAEEALQDVFVNIWRNASAFNVQRGRPMTWLISIARYRAIDVRRRRKHESMSQDVGELAEVLPDERVDVSEQAVTSLEAQRLAECLGHLSSQQDRCIRLAFIDGLSHEEIAARITSPIGTVKSWIRRGLLALKECLAA